MRDVEISVSDGLIRKPPGDGVQVKLGASPVPYTEPVLISSTLSIQRIRERVGMSPLADACIVGLENGASAIYCIPVKPDTAGTVGDISKKGADGGIPSGNMTISGEPNNSYDIAVKVTKSGGFNEAVVKYSFDGGVSYLAEVTMPIDGILKVAPTGLTLSFVEGEGDVKFVVGDTFSATTTAPKITNDAILAALPHVREIRDTVEFVHIVGETDKSLWAALAVEATRFFETYKKPIFFSLEPRRPKPDETAKTYTDAMLADRKAVNSYFIQVCPIYGRYRDDSGITRSLCLSEITSGMYARAGVAQSISELDTFAVSDDKLLALEPPGIEDEIDRLDEVGYLTFRRYVGVDGFYVTRPCMLSPEKSDYKYAEHVRVLNKCARKVRAEALHQLHRSINLDKQDVELAALGKIISTPLETMAQAGEISSGYAEIPPGQDIIHDETLTIRMRFVPRGYIRAFVVDLGMSNPLVQKEG